MPSSKSESSPFLVSIGDLFGQPIFLNLRKQQAVSTSLGGLLTLILILLMVSQFAFDIIKMTDRQNPQILQINEVSNDPLPVLLNQSNNFNFAISTTVNGQHINMTTGSILNFKAASSLYLRNGENKTKYDFQINFSPCEPSDFSDSIFGNQTYEMYQIQYAYCPRYISYFLPNGTCPDFIEDQYPNCVSPLVFNISGTYLLPYFSFIQFNFTLCDNTDSNVQTPSQMQCMNLSDIYSLFNNDVQVQVNFFFANNLINPVLYQTPNQTYLDFIYWDVNPRLFKVADIFVSNQIVQDYDSYYSSTDNQNSTFYHIDSSQLREQQSYLFTNVTNQSILEFNLRGDVSSSVITRVYMKVQDVMSQLGGLAKSIMVGFAFIALGYANFKYHMVVSNELYDFEPVDDNDTKKTENKKRLERKKEMENIRKRLDGNNLKERIIQRDYMKDALAQQIEEEEAEKEKVKDYFEYQKKKQRRLKYNEIAYLKSLICCRKATPEEQIAEKARAQVEEDVDLIQILQKLKEVDKLKGLLLDRNQRELFDYIPKPLLTVEGDQPVNCSFDVSYIGADFQAEKDMAGIIQRRENFNSLSEYAKLYISYRGVTSAKDPLKQNHNKKLLAMLGPDLIKVFEHVDKEVGDEVHPEHFEAIIKKALDYSQHHKTIRVEY